MGIVEMSALSRAFQRVREELAVVGLLADGRYLDRIDCERCLLPSFASEQGWVYDGGVDLLRRFIGFRPGVIYIPPNSSTQRYSPGNTLKDVIRHEFAHAWAWLDLAFVDGPWFRRTFGARYHEAWEDRPEFDRRDFVSEYATTMPKEDFAETFMLFLRHRDSLDRFMGRAGLHRKLKAVQRAVEEAASYRMHRIRGPRV